jgi:hypothetical protein
MSRLLKTWTFVALIAASLTASVSAQELVTVKFTNRTNAPAQVYWNNGGDHRHYLDLAPGESRQLQTYIGHMWSVTGQETAMGATVVRSNQEFVLGGRRPAPTPRPAPAPRPAEEVDPNFFPFNSDEEQPAPRPSRRPRPAPQPQPIEPEQVRGSSVNQAVVNYARSVVGQRIGNGQCTELATAALQAAGARPAQSYNWGERLNGTNELQPGDILQMFSASFSYPDGRQAWSTGPHTAVVVSVRGSTIEVLEQNVAGSPVQRGTYDMNCMTAGRMEYYRPVAGNSGSRPRSNNPNVFGWLPFSP